MPRTLGRSELSRLRDASNNSEDPLSSPIVTILLDTGLRVSELCSLDLEDIDLDDLSALVIGGKGRKTVQFCSRLLQLRPLNHGYLSGNRELDSQVLVMRRGHCYCLVEAGG